MTTRRGPLLIVSGPSGSGKSTLIRWVLKLGDLPLRLSVSVTTRQPRCGECDGLDYHFWTVERFRKAVTEGAFLEHAEVHDRCYGTLREEVDPYLERGMGVLLDIDFQGAREVRARCPGTVSIFIKTPTWEDYELRLRARGTENEERIQRRLRTAREELKHVDEYEHVVVNDDLSRACAEFRELIARQF